MLTQLEAFASDTSTLNRRAIRHTHMSKVDFATGKDGHPCVLGQDGVVDEDYLFCDTQRS